MDPGGGPSTKSAGEKLPAVKVIGGRWTVRCGRSLSYPRAGEPLPSIPASQAMSPRREGPTFEAWVQLKKQQV